MVSTLSILTIKQRFQIVKRSSARQHLLWFQAFSGLEIESVIERGSALLQEGVEIYRSIGDLANTAGGLVQLGMLQLWAGQLAEGEASLEQGATIWQEIGGSDYLIAARCYVGITQMLRGQYKGAFDGAGHHLTQTTKAGLHREVALALYVSSGTLLAQRAFEQARNVAGQSIAVFREIGQQDELAWVLAVEACAALSLGDRKQAEQSIRTALSIAVRCHTPIALAFALPVVALLQAERKRPTRAIEIYALAMRDPVVANACWFEDIAGQHIASLARTLPPDAVATARERGQLRDPWATAEELLTELGG